MRFKDPAVSFRNLTKIFDTHRVLSNLNFDVPKNKIVTILGFSGAGKSTIFKHILGIISPTYGDIEVLGQNIKKLNKVDLREFRRNFGMLFQYAALFDSLTALQNVIFPLKEFTQMNAAEMKEKASELLNSVGLGAKSFHKFPAQLSGGMRKRVGLARALALHPRIMLYDEPTTGLDPITTKTVNNLIVQTQSKDPATQMTSIIISHDVKASLEISDFVVFLEHGKIMEYLPASEFKNSSNKKIQEFVSL